jgi:hypothetical protein
MYFKGYSPVSANLFGRVSSPLYRVFRERGVVEHQTEEGIDFFLKLAATKQYYELLVGLRTIGLNPLFNVFKHKNFIKLVIILDLERLIWIFQIHAPTGIRTRV